MTAVEHHALEVYPEECCGILLGSSSQAVSHLEAIASAAVATRNDYSGPRETRYSIPPEDLLHAHRKAGREGRVVIGYYHSHPNRPAVPSRTDRELALPEVSYLIVSVSSGGVGERRAWRLGAVGSHFEEEIIEAISDQDACHVVEEIE